VNPFQAKEIYTPEKLVTGEGLDYTQAILDTATAPANVWRDTVFIPNRGFTRIYQRFGGRDIAWAGKTVFHCHFLNHEDQGMISAMMIGDPNVAYDIQPTGSPTKDSQPAKSPTKDSQTTDSPTSSARSNGITFAAAFVLSTSLYTFMM
jgi:hypothetical protein